jgi:endonuclease YncB( thermonuclease family)
MSHQGGASLLDIERAKSIGFQRTATCCIALFALFLGATCANAQIAGKVITIQDGDTLTIVDLEGSEYRIRLAGIDAPEKGQRFGYASLSKLSDLCYGRLVSATCPKMDQYGRHVCTVWLNGTDLNLAQVASGLAWHYKRFEHEQSPEEREAYASAEEKARLGRLGLWQDDQPTPPWDWRRNPPPAAH